MTSHPMTGRSPRAQRSKHRGWLAASGLVTAALGFSALPGIPGVSAANAAVRRVPFQQYSSCPKLLSALRTLTLPQVGPYGLGGVYYPQATSGTGTTSKPLTKSTPVPASATDAGAPATTAAPAVSPAPAVAVSADPTAAAQANSSATNVQEVGVDEGDSVENDGRYIYTAVGGLLRIIDTSTGKQVADLGQTNGTEQLLLDGTVLAVVAAEYNVSPETTVTLWDVTDRSAPRRLSETHLEGSPLAIRNVGNRARIVLQTGFAQRLKFVQPTGGDEKTLLAAQKANRKIVNTSGVDAWLPRSYVVRGNGSQTSVKTAIDCREVGRPAGNSGLGFTWVATVDLNTPNPREGGRGSGGVIASGQTVYASAGNLFVATTDYGQSAGGPVPIIVRPPGVLVPQAYTSTATIRTATASTKKTTAKKAPTTVPTRTIAPQQAKTAIHMFDLTPPDGATYRASGSVAGTLLNQFSMSEWQGNLRVATTTQRVDFGTQQASGIHVLQRSGRSLNEIGLLDGLGRTERIYAVRFVGDLGYVVTFRQTDPLYVVDLRNPKAPELVGELKIPGYSSYLQPIGPGRLLGIGQDATDSGRVQGTQLSLFDVSNPRNPVLLTAYRIGGSSQAEYDHHAFLWWPATGDVIVPFSNYDPTRNIPDNGVVVASVSDSGIKERGRITHESTFVNNNPGPIPSTKIPGGSTAPTASRPVFFTEAIQRSMIVDGNLVTISPNVVKSSNLSALSSLWTFSPGTR
jgi:hypothetical protein